LTPICSNHLSKRDLERYPFGGDGGLGVITEATLALTDNVRVKREDRTMPIAFIVSV
jgi:hypothetical protein